MKTYCKVGKNIFRQTAWLFTVKHVGTSLSSVASRVNSLVKNRGQKSDTMGTTDSFYTVYLCKIGFEIFECTCNPKCLLIRAGFMISGFLITAKKNK